MLKRITVSVLVFAFAFAVLLLSTFRAAAVRYEFAGNSIRLDSKVLGDENVNIDYQLPYPGRVLPDSPFWPLKAMRDKAWLWITTNPTRKAELKLLFADKRLGSARVLFEKGKPEEGLTTLTKAEKYLEEAGMQAEENKKNKIDIYDFFHILANASLKHYQEMQEILNLAPEEARPTIIQAQDYPKRVFENSRNALLEKGRKVPENPFDW